MSSRYVERVGAGLASHWNSRILISKVLFTQIPVVNDGAVVKRHNLLTHSEAEVAPDHDVGTSNG